MTAAMISTRFAPSCGRVLFDATLSLVIAVHQNFIYEASLGGEHFDPEAHEQKFNQLFEYLLDAARS